MQSQAVSPPPPPAQAPQVPTAIRIEGAPGAPAQTITIPLSAGEVRELRARRSELLDQLQRAQNRRELVVSELPGAEGANRAGLEQRLAVLDERIMQLESEMAATERAVAASPGSARSDAVEAIAVEVERVSEGQRFVTKLLSNAERKPASLPADL